MEIILADGSNISVVEGFIKEALVIEGILCGDIAFARSLAGYTDGMFDDMLMAATAASNPSVSQERIQAMLLNHLKRSINDRIQEIESFLHLDQNSISMEDHNG